MNTIKRKVYKRLASVFTALVMLSACTAPDSSVADDDGQMITQKNEPVIARVNGSPIYVSEINNAAMAAGIIKDGEPLSADNPLYGDMRDELIDQRLLAQRAKEMGLDKSMGAKRRIQTARERILGAIVVEDHLAKTVTDEAAKKLYGAQMAIRDNSEEVRASHILVETEAQATKVTERIKAGEAFAKIAFDVSKDEGSRLDGGDLGYFQKTAMIAPFSEAVFALKKDEISDPFETEFGWHIAKLTGRRTPPVPPFAQMRDELISYLTYDELKKFGDSLRDDAEIELAPASAELQIEPNLNPQDLPSDMSNDEDNEAQDEQ